MKVQAQFDHLVVAIRSLSEGIDEFERLTGVKPGAGGSHPGRGTENALVSLGAGSYLEIIAPQPGAALSAKDEPIRAVRHLRIIDWAVSVSGVKPAIGALNAAGFTTSTPRSGSRVTPTGERLEWTVFGLSGASLAVAPFFIHWNAGTKHPSTTAPGGCALATLTIADPSADRLTAALSALGVEVVTTATGDARIEAQLAYGRSRATLSSAR